ncbi:MAG: hypothetical protein Q7U03_14075 [Syntrophales bacterium]|nr:hypothetical protein [Syntrophales bacterium]
MSVFSLTLHPTYYKKGFFNVTVDFDRFVRSQEGNVFLRLGSGGPQIQGRIDRRANRNGTARIIGGAKLRDWFQKHYRPMDVVAVDLSSPEIIILHTQTDQ